MKNVGTMSIGVRTGVIKEGDDLAEITVNSVLNACDELNLPLEDKDIIAVTEAVVSISMGNYCTVDDIVRVNGIKNPDKINVGEKIYIPKYVLKMAKEPIVISQNV